MPIEPIVTFPGIQHIISCTYTRGQGISPGFATVECAPQEEWPERQGTLRFEYGEFVREFRDCVTDNLSFSFDSSGQLWRLLIMDRRWKWRYGYINGRYNVRLPNGPVDKLDPRTEKTPEELIWLLLNEMGEYGAQVGRLPTMLRPSIAWDHANPAQELAYLCDTFGMAIVLQDNGDVGIFPRGWGDLAGTRRSQFSKEQLIADSGTSDPPELPDKVYFVCGPSRFQVDYPLDAVNDDIDGLIKPIRELSYAPKEKDASGNETQAVDISRFDLVNFTNVPLFNPADPKGVKWGTLASPRELARAGVFKKYRVRVRKSRRGDDPNGYEILGYPLSTRIVGEDSGGTDWDGKFPDDIRLVLPMGAELVEPTFDPVSGWYRPLNCIIWGWYNPGGGVANNIPVASVPGFNETMWRLGSADFKPPIKYYARDPSTGQITQYFNTTVIPPEKYSLDPDTGVITFAERVTRAADDTDPTIRRGLDAVLWARLTVTVCDPKTLIPTRLIFSHRTSDIIGFMNEAPLGTEPLIIRDDDIFLRVQPKYNPDAPEKLSNEALPYEDNFDFIQAYARERVTAEMRKFQVIGGRAVTYAGFVRADMSGDIVQVTFAMGQGGATTSMSLNSEIAALTIPYSERRFLEKIKNEKLDEAMSAYNKLLFERGFAFSKTTNLMRTGR